MTVLRHPNGALQELGCGARWGRVWAGGGPAAPAMRGQAAGPMLLQLAKALLQRFVFGCLVDTLLLQLLLRRMTPFRSLPPATGLLWLDVKNAAPLVRPPACPRNCSACVYKALYRGEPVAAKEVDLGRSPAVQAAFLTVRGFGGGGQCRLRASHGRAAAGGAGRCGLACEGGGGRRKGPRTPLFRAPGSEASILLVSGEHSAACPNHVEPAAPLSQEAERLHQLRHAHVVSEEG